MRRLTKERIKFEMTPEIMEIVDRYSNCSLHYAQNDAEEIAFRMLDRMTEYERTIFILFVELQSCRKVAELIGVTHETANRAHQDVKRRMNELI